MREEQNRAEKSRIEVLYIRIDEVGVVSGAAGAGEGDEVVRGSVGRFERSYLSSSGKCVR
jgi:hypothetical protein